MANWFSKGVLLAGTVLATCGAAWAGQIAGCRFRARHSRSAITTASMRPSNSPTPSRSPIPSTTSCSASSGLAIPSPATSQPLYKGQVLVHGMGYSPDHHTLAVVSIGSNSVTFIDTATNAVKHTTYVGRSPHEAFYTPDGKEVWVTVRGENYISVLDAQSFEEKTRIVTPAGPGMQIFSPDGKYGYICSSFNPEIDVVTVADHKIVATVKQDSPFCPNIAATPDGKQVWFTLKDTGKTQVFNAEPPFDLIKTHGHRSDHQSRQFRAHGQRHSSLTSRSAAPTRSRCSAPMTSRKSPRSRSAICHTAYGRPATARASMSGWRTPMRWPPSTPRPTG